MTELEKFIKKLRELADATPPSHVVLPKNDVGLPEGTFILHSFLNYIANCLESKQNGEI